MGGKSSAPPPPDPNAVSNAQTTSNVNTALVNTALNRYNTNTPLGSSSWTTNGYTKGPDGTMIPNQTNTISLNPTAQAALNTQQQNQLGQAQTEQGFLGNVSKQLQNPINGSQFSPIQTGLNSATMGDPSVNNAEQTAFNSQYNLVSPLMQQQTQGMQDQMRAEGIPEGSDLWNTMSQNVGRQQSNQISGLAANAVGQGIGLQSNLFNQGLAAHRFRPRSFSRIQPYKCRQLTWPGTTTTAIRARSTRLMQVTHPETTCSEV
jgi:hypothetical protein